MLNINKRIIIIIALIASAIIIFIFQHTSSETNVLNQYNVSITIAVAFGQIIIAFIIWLKYDQRQNKLENKKIETLREMLINIYDHVGIVNDLLYNYDPKTEIRYIEKIEQLKNDITILSGQINDTKYRIKVYGIHCNLIILILHANNRQYQQFFDYASSATKEIRKLLIEIHPKLESELDDITDFRAINSRDGHSQHINH